MILHIALVAVSVRERANKENRDTAIPCWLVPLSIPYASNVTGFPAPEKENSSPSPAQETFHKTFQNSYLRIIRSKDMPAHREKKSDQTAEIVALLITAVK